MAKLTAAELAKSKDLKLPSSEWVLINQAMVNAFAEVTLDRQFIHIDEERAAIESPFGGTIAHGFLTLSLLSSMAEQSFPQIEGAKGTLNYGLEKLRFLSPVHTGSKIRAHFKLLECAEKSPNRLLARYKVSIEIEGSKTPALVTDWLAMVLLDSN